VNVHPGAVLSGDVHLGDGVTIGTGACVIQGVHIGAGTFVGAGAAVVNDLPAGVVAVGVPARPTT
jgi:acetyltransferase-like isoleucine patch superfamily enzyme